MSKELFDLLMRNEYEAYEKRRKQQEDEVERVLKKMGFCLMVGLLLIAALELCSIS